VALAQHQHPVGEAQDLGDLAGDQHDGDAGRGEFVDEPVQLRARVLKAVGDVPGLKVSCEGEGRNRRVVFTPDKLAPLPKRSMLPADDDEDELEG
jgi:hypothetical protein